MPFKRAARTRYFYSKPPVPQHDSGSDGGLDGLLINGQDKEAAQRAVARSRLARLREREAILEVLGAGGVWPEDL